MQKVKLSEIKIKEEFVQTPPKADKLDKYRRKWNETHKQSRFLVLDEGNVLVDGYAQYLILLEQGEEFAETKRKYKKPMLIEQSDTAETVYVFGKHCVRDKKTKSVSISNDNEYVWQIPKRLIDNGVANQIRIGDYVFVSTKHGIKKIVVTRLVKSDTPPVSTQIREVISKAKK